MARGEVWGLTWRELFRDVALSVETRRDQHNRDMTLAWQTANLSRAKKLPGLDRFLVKPPSAGAQSVSEMRTMLQRLSARYGGRVRSVHG